MQEASETTSEPASQGSAHTRNVSHARRQAMLRRTTKGPLDDDADDPLSQTPPPPQLPSRLSVAPETRSPSRSPARSPARAVPNAPRKNFGFLLRPDNFHQLTATDVPPSFHNPAINIEPSEQLLSKAISEGRFRTAAGLAADLLKSKSDPSDAANIFSLFYARLVCLQLSGLGEIAAQEAKAIQDVNAPIYLDDVTKKHLVPWPLRVITVRLQAVSFSDWRRAVMSFYDLAREARFEGKRAADGDRELWARRLEDVGIQIANALVEMGDLDAAARFLRALPHPESAENITRLALVYLALGNVVEARTSLEALSGGEHHQIFKALCSMVEGDFVTATTQLEDLHKQSRRDISPAVAQNLATCLLYTARIQEAQAVLEELIDAGHTSQDLLFNLATTFELCSERAREHKAALAVRVAKQKPSGQGWERSNADFKM